jgi:DNA helicase-2/ATP-dependent DNA helicase PcrA
MNWIAGLNGPQRDAVLHDDGPLLILAGAGSGKTRVLTHRIARLLSEGYAEPDNVLAVTFTNKAAAEMRHRVEHLLAGDPRFRDALRSMWIGTFHSSCVRILRSDIHRLDYSNSFTIYDDADQLSTIKAAMKELNISDQSLSPKAVQARINKVKNDGEDHTTYQPQWGGPREDAFCRLFERYAEALKMASAVDFADLIQLTVKLFKTHPDVLAKWRLRFRYLLIDEYQDTNKSQYLMMKLLAGQDANLCAVGDEDQSIYKWRGADISNILNFERDFPRARIIKLEQNYRSTKTIIEAASRVIAYNTSRRDKTLWTDNVQGEPIRVFECYDEHDEATKTVAEIQKLIAEGASLNDFAIFYRTNAQSRVLEDMLRAKGLPYQIYGGLKFYDRLEVKDALAYLRLIVNPNDDASFRRVVNVPARAIGAVSLEKLEAIARNRRESLYGTLAAIFGPAPEVSAEGLGRAAKAFRGFYELMEQLREARDRLLPSDMLTQVLEESGYRKSLSDEGTQESQTRLENLGELRQSIVEYELRAGAERPDRAISLEGFLEEIALVSSTDRFDPEAPAVKMMTIHMAKGLEFDHVAIVGLEEELFPNVRPWELEDDADLEEERRLFYVGMTRARKTLRLFHAKNRTLYGNASYRVSSRFLEEIPDEYLETHKADYFSRRRPFLERTALPRRFSRSGSVVAAPFHHDEAPVESDDQESNFDEVCAVDDYTQVEGEVPMPGARVEHPTFGLGVVRRFLGGDKLMVEFPGRGLKKISLRFTPLKLL